MAEILLSPLLDNLISSLGSALVKEIRVVWGIEEELESLCSTLSAIRSLMADAEEKQVQNNTLRDWLRKLKDAAYDAEDVVDIFSFEALQAKQTGDSKKRKEVRNLFSCFCLKKVAFRHEIGYKIQDIRKRLDEIAKERTQFHLSETSVARPIKRPYSGPLIDAPTILGREAEKDELIKNLLVPNGPNSEKHPIVIPIVAMGGLGKTTLARLVYNSEEAKQHFQVRGWVCVSDRFEIERVTREIVESITGEKPEVSHPEGCLKNLIEGKRFLIVIDDVWDDALGYLDDFCIPFTYGDQGSKLIVTTRSEKVSLVMGTSDPIHLSRLPDDDCLKLLTILVDIGKKIVEKCRGVPLAINTLGGLLTFERSESKWNGVLESSFWELPQEENSILPALRLSYHNLPPEVKPCFTFCSLFPKDYRFNKDVLIRMWMAQGYLQSDRRREEEDVGDEYFNDLLMRSFFSRVPDSKIEYTMHDLVHDLAESLAKEEFIKLHDDKLDPIHGANSIPEKAHHAYLIIEEEIQVSFIKRFERLRTLVVDPSLLNPSEFDWVNIIQEIKYLRVLSLRWCMIDRLPDDLGSLRLLRYIDLSCTMIEELPDSISNLLYLQSLDLHNCVCLTKLPDDLGSLRLLRYIDLSYSGILELPDSICNLLYLQSLNLHNCQYLKKLPDDLGSLRLLRYIDLSYSVIEELPDSICNLLYLQSLNLKLCRNLKKLPIDLGSLRQLRYIDLSCATIEELPDSFCNLLYLQSLPLGNCENLKKLPDDLGSLQLLQYIDLSDTRIEELPDSICNLLHLQSLNLGNNTNLKKLPADLGSLRLLRYIDLSSTAIEELPDSICNLLYLQSLDLTCCANLKKLPNNISSLTNLRYLDIEYCDSLTYMPTQIGKLTNLRRMTMFIVGKEVGKKIVELDGLNSLKGRLVIKGLENIVDGEEAKETGLKNKQLGELQLCWTWAEARDGSIDEDVLENLLPHINLESLILDGYQGNSLPSWLSNLPSLKQLGFMNCWKLSTLPEDLEKLGSLKHLELNYCPKMSSLPRCGLPKSLKQLEITACHLLKESMSIDGSIDEDVFENLQPHINLEYLSLEGYQGTSLPNLPSLKALCLNHCRELVSLPEDLEKLGSLEYLRLMNCPKISSLPRCGLPKSLKRFEIIHCPLLKKSCNRDNGRNWPKVAHIPDVLIH